MKNILLLVILSSVIGISSGAWADSQSAFAKLKTLSGKWITNNEGGKPAEVTYEVIADGSALLERSMGMVTVYYPDNNSILVTHYCTTHTQPRMRATQFSEPVSSLDFSFVDVSNVQGGQGYIDHLNINFKDNNHIIETWNYGVGDKNLDTTVFNLARE